jgi:hypothetical protein
MKLRIILILLIVISIRAFSAEPADTLRMGDKSLIFNLSGAGINPGNFKGGVGYQFFINKSTAIRLPIGIGYRSSTMPKPDNSESAYSETDYSFSLTPGIRTDAARGWNVIAYYGAELIASYDNRDTSGINNKNQSITSNVYKFGGALFAGAEWFPVKSLSLSLEYSLSFVYSSGSTLYKSGTLEQTRDFPSTFDIKTGLGGLGFILTFYFN